MGRRRAPGRMRHGKQPSGHLPVVLIALTALLVIAALIAYFAS